jgi:predicted signal transduction protein with EAL and GGDEF domain
VARILGVGRAIDDFGTGYSSLGYVGRLPVDELKLGRSFVASIAADADAARLVHAIVKLAHDVGLTTVAEGWRRRRTSPARAAPPASASWATCSTSLAASGRRAAPGAPGARAAGWSGAGPPDASCGRP